MKAAKYLGILLLVIVSLFLFVANFSSVTSNYECTGEISSGESKESKTLFIVLEEYRWWVSLWSDSYGNVQLEIPNEHVGYYSYVIEAGNQFQIYNTPKEMKGSFSTLSKTLALKTPYGLFDGNCTSSE